MSAPVLWIFFPGLAAAILYALRRWERVVLIVAVVISLGLAWLAWNLPVGEPIRLGIWAGFPSFTIGDTFEILGRRLVIGNVSRPLLVLIYLGISFWFGGARVAGVNRLFIPLGLAMAALLTAALSVDPFLYAALIIEIAALISVPILSPPGKPVVRGALRFLSFQTLGMPFILFTGFLLERIQDNPNDTFLIVRATALIALGFAFIMAVFPFHSWIPMLAEEAHPYEASFVFFILPAVIAMFGISFLERYTWLQASRLVFLVLRFVGMLMVLSAGLLAAFQFNLGRILGYAASMEIGLSLLAISLGVQGPDALYPPDVQAAGGRSLQGIFFAQLLPRGIGLALWALALAILKAQVPDLRYRSFQGLARRMPIAAAGLLLAQFSLAGFPLLAGFPVSVALLSALAQESLPVAVLTVLGQAGLMTAGLRTLAVLIGGPGEETWRISESWPQVALLSISGLVLLAVGLMPQWFMPFLINVAQMFGPAVQ